MSRLNKPLGGLKLNKRGETQGEEFERTHKKEIKRHLKEYRIMALRKKAGKK